MDRFLVHLIDDTGGLESHVVAADFGANCRLYRASCTLPRFPRTVAGASCRRSELRIAHLETGEMRSICGLSTGWSPVRWSTSGNEIFLFEPGGDHATANLSRINIHTGEQHPWLTLRPADSIGAYLLKWVDIAPDGRSYAYTYQQDLSDLYILDGLT